MQNLYWLLSGMGQMQSGCLGDIQEIAITWKVIIMPGEGLHSLKGF